MAFCLRKRAEHEAGVYFASLSSRTIVYKGMLSAPQVEPFFPDLSDERYASNLALVHSRFSTNTFPSWPRSHPYRYVAHNGEINTVQGNRNWMRAREAMLRLAADPGVEVGPGASSGCSRSSTPTARTPARFDECLELLHLGGRSLPHALLMMIPEPWENHDEMDARRRAFYQFHAALMEPWDGPALIAFTDGTVIGAVLDRNGLRPGRYWVTDDGLVDPGQRGRRARHRARPRGAPGPAPARPDLPRRHRRGPASSRTRRSRPSSPPSTRTQDWLHAGLVHLDDLPDRERHRAHRARTC